MPFSALTANPPVLLLQLSPEVRDLLDRILVPKEEERITIPEIEAHPWYGTLQSSFDVVLRQVTSRSVVTPAMWLMLWECHRAWQ